MSTPINTSPSKQSNNYGWTNERRQAARERALANKPWQHSTGPKSKGGKARSAQNARKQLAEKAKMITLTKEILLLNRTFMNKYKALVLLDIGIAAKDKTTNRQNELIKTMINQGAYPTPLSKNQKQTDTLQHPPTCRHASGEEKREK